MSNRTIPPIACLLLLSVCLIPHRDLAAQNAFGGAPGTVPNPSAIAGLLGVSDLTLQELQFSSVPTSAELIIEIELGGQPYTLSLEPYTLRGDEFRVLIDAGTGALTEVPAPPITTRRGSVMEIAGSKVYATWDGTGLTASIQLANGSFGIQPVATVASGHDSAWHAVYDVRNLLPTGHTCGVTSSGSIGGTGGGGPMPLGGGTNYFLTEIAADADFEFYQDNNSSVALTVQEIEGILNGVESAYDNPGIEIVYELTTVVVRTNAADPYGTQANHNIMLNTFESVWQSAPESAIDRDVAHLFTGVNITGSVIGVAELSEICTNFSYGLSQANFSNNANSVQGLVAHELGHNWAAQHCNGAASCRIMCDTLGGCNGLTPLTFAPTPETQIINYRNSRNCLSVRAPAIPIPFFDDFATTSLNVPRWSYNRGGVISTQGVGEPSAPLSIVLDSAGSGIYSDDELRSNYILLAGITDAHLSFYLQHRGVDAGEQLFVEYLNSSLTWVPLDNFTSNGVNETTFTQHVYFLPPNARHNKFRVKFRTEGNSSSDDWFIDNVLVDSGTPVPPAPPTLFLITPDTGTIAGGTLVTINGSNFAPDAAVTFGSDLLQNIQFIDDSEIRGNAPARTSGGAVDVVISQVSGADILANGFTYTSETIRHGDSAGPPGGTISVPVYAEHDSTLSGFSLAIDFDPSLVEIVAVTDVGTAAEGADFFQPGYNNSSIVGGGWWTLGVVLSLTGGGVTITPSPDSVIALATYAIDPSLPLGVDIPLAPISGVGAPATDNLLVGLSGLALTPILASGQITTSGVSFIRGDVNGDSGVDIADAISVLAYLFSAGPGSCLDALDSNDDGAVNIADAIYVLDFLFSAGSPPPAPYPSPGIDPTADPLDCA